jgi:hypothetical protein
VPENNTDPENETAYGGDCEKPAQGAWFCQFMFTICCQTQPPPECDETAWGMGIPATCFSALGLSNWGWTNQITIAGTYTLYLYAGAAQCDINKGTLVGEAVVVFDGSTATVNYTAYSGFTFAETHVYIGKLPLPKTKTGAYNSAPGQFPYKAGASVTITAPFYVAAHAKVVAPCDAFKK